MLLRAIEVGREVWLPASLFLVTLGMAVYYAFFND
jgi:hypothetical protein